MKSTAVSSPDPVSLPVLLRRLKLPSFVAAYDESARKAEREGWTFDSYLRHLVDLEVADRERRRLERNLKRSGLPGEKTLGTLEVKRLPRRIQTQLPGLCEGGFVDRAENLLAFGLPGRGKTHVVAAIGHELVARGYRVLFQPAYSLVQLLLLAKRDFMLERQLKRLDGFEVVIIDDVGYIQQDREEMEVLFTFLSERYERRSVVITSNLVFSEWDKIFKDPMTTAAAIDRVVHHATILELNGPSFRAEEAQKRNQALKLSEDRVEQSSVPQKPKKRRKGGGKAGD
jgi:DNA replication protein DnaC